ncbi:MAG: nicotinate-nucleotide--dimethylbenzimidazole phosphoribosyltransferase [Lachnospiraceae bacterium]
MTKEELYGLRFREPDSITEQIIKDRWDNLAKPLDGLGQFESMIGRLGAITGMQEVNLTKKLVLIFCADNGIVEEGVSQTGQEVTAIVAENMAKGQSSVCKMAACIGADTAVIDIGVSRELTSDGIVHKKIAYGTNNFSKEPAMSEAQALQAIEIGIELVKEYKEAGYAILALGEMGIGNTTTGSAVAAALLGCPADVAVGKGAGLSEAGLLKKRKVVGAALQKYRLSNADALTVLTHVGGLDIAALAGVCIGGALYRIPVVLDGAISASAALLAERLLPGVKDFLIPSHMSREPVAKLLLQELKLHPVIDADMALGEGTGAVLLLSLLETVLSVYRQQASFQDAAIEKYRRNL